jgi:hypothetical protein
MNAWNERGSDSENFGERINEFEVTVAKIWRKNHFLFHSIYNFWKWLGVCLELFLKIRGASYECVDCRLIMERGRGFFVKWNFLGLTELFLY